MYSSIDDMRGGFFVVSLNSTGFSVDGSVDDSCLTCTLILLPASSLGESSPAWTMGSDLGSEDSGLDSSMDFSA